QKLRERATNLLRGHVPLPDFVVGLTLVGRVGEIVGRLGADMLSAHIEAGEEVSLRWVGHAHFALGFLLGRRRFYVGRLGRISNKTLEHAAAVRQAMIERSLPASNIETL